MFVGDFLELLQGRRASRVPVVVKLAGRPVGVVVAARLNIGAGGEVFAGEESAAVQEMQNKYMI